MSSFCPAVPSTDTLLRCMEKGSSSMSICEPMPTVRPAGPALLEHLDALYGYALMLTRSQAEAEDLVQETCLRALRAEATLQPNSHLKSWFFTILRNLFLNRLRQAPTRKAMLDIDAEDTSEAAWQRKHEDDPEVAFLKQWEREQVQVAVQSLPALYREVVVLREWEDLSYQEIAQILGCPVGTVMSRLSRAREKLEGAMNWEPTQRGT